MNWPALIAMIGFLWMVILFWFMEYDWRKDAEDSFKYHYSKLSQKEKKELDENMGD